MLHSSGSAAASDRDSIVRADVAILGGGPAASIAAAVLLEHAPKTRTIIVEASGAAPERRDDLLLRLGVDVLREVGVWNRVDAKPTGTEVAHVEACRVDRATLEGSLLERAGALGAEVIRGASQGGVVRAGDRLERVTLADGRVIVADWYIDGSGGDGSRPTAVVGENWLAFADTSGLADASMPVGPTLECVMGRSAGCAVAVIAGQRAERRWVLDQYAAAWADQIGVHARLTAAREGLQRGDAVDRAWNTVAAGGFAPVEPRRAMVGVFSMAEAVALLGGVGSGRPRTPYALEAVNVIKPNLLGAKQDCVAEFREGGVRRAPCLRRDGQTLPLAGVFEHLLDLLKQHTVVGELLDAVRHQEAEGDNANAVDPQGAVVEAIEGLEFMLRGGWLMGRMDKRRSLGDWSASLDGLGATGRPRDRTRNAPEPTVRPAIR